MNKLLRKIWCWLTGGHRYEDRNLESYHFPNDGVTCFRNVCVKCGHAYTCEISDIKLYRDVYRGADDGRKAADFL